MKTAIEFLKNWENAFFFPLACITFQGTRMSGRGFLESGSVPDLQFLAAFL